MQFLKWTFTFKICSHPFEAKEEKYLTIQDKYKCKSKCPLKVGYMSVIMTTIYKNAQGGRSF